MLGREASYEAELQAGDSAARRPARKVALRFASGAWPNVLDPLARETRRGELVGNDTTEIEVSLVRPIARVDVSVSVLEAAREFDLNLVTARPDRRAEQRANRARARALAHHRAHSRPRYPGQRSTPSGVQRSNHATLAVGKQNRHAIGGKDAEHNTGHRRNQSVGFGTRIGIGPRADHLDRFAVDLFQLGETPPKRHQAARALPVDVNGARVIADPIREIQKGIWTAAGASLAAEKAVTKRGIIPSSKYGRGRRKRCSSTKRAHSMSEYPESVVGYRKVNL